tara:strand:+ start:108 stop:449 length:342 start_codon:yes stop_codon:yes gene_type:complete
MPIVYRYNNGQLPAAANEVFRVSSVPMVVTSMWLCNTDTSKRTVSIYHIPSDEDVSDEHLLLDTFDVRPKTTTIVDTPFFLEQGDSVVAFADVADKVSASFYAIPFATWNQSR